MNFNLLTKITQLLRSKQRRGRWLKAVSCMAAVVVFCTTYALILPAITMTATCGLEEHTHTAACYANDDTLIWLCQQEEQETAVHQHDETCYDENGLLTCGIADFVLHTHDADTCYDAEGNLICTLPEITSYSKTTLFLTANGDDANYEDSENVWVSTPSSLQFDLFTVEGAEDTELFLPNGYTVLDSQEAEVWTEAHTHSADCYDQDGKLICGQLEVAQHQHTMECLQGTLICGLEEHQHSQDCYASAKETYLCGLEEHQHEEACYDEEGNLICTLEEHVHTEACLASKEQQEEETEQTLTTQVDDATISVTFPTDALPEGVILQAQEIAQESDDYAAYYQQALQAMQDQAETELTLSFARFFDITFLADGAEVEPTAPVAVTITYADGIALAGNESSGAVHFAADDIQVLDVQIEGSEDTIDAFTFTQDSFSVTGTVLALDASSFAVEVAVGETLEITGTAANYHSWSSGDASIAMISGSSAAATVTGKAAGETTITHKYGTKKNKLDNEETFTVTVVEAMKEASGNGFTVKVTGNKNKLPDGVELVVEEVAANYGDDSYDDSYYNAMIDGLNEAGAATTTLQHGSEHATTDFDFLHLYHIWLRQADGAEYTLSEVDNLNLNVTITYAETPEGWESLKANGAWVGHYKKENGSIVAKSIAETGTASTLTPKNIKVKGNSISFHIKSFSIITITSGQTIVSFETDDGIPITETYGELTLDELLRNGFISEKISQTEWEIGTAGYYKSINGTRLIKTVVPTGIEDVFKVQVMIERDPSGDDIEEILKNMGAWFVNQNDGHVQDKYMGDIVDAVGYHNGDTGLTADINSGTSTKDYLNIIYVDEKGNELSSYRAYPTYSTYNNGSYKAVVAPLPNGKWLLVSDGKSSIKWGDTVRCILSDTIIEEIKDEMAPKIGVLGVEDTIDLDRFIYLGQSATIDKQASTEMPMITHGEITAPNNLGNISWTGLESLSVNTKATMTYYVRLRTSTIDGAGADIDAVTYSDNGPVINSGQVYQEGIVTANLAVKWQKVTSGSGSTTSTTLSANETITITEPSVRGLLYYIKLEKIEKVEETEITEETNSNSTAAKKLMGAEFSVYRGTDTTGTPVATITTDANGIGVSTPGLPWGEYTLVETKPPTGYRLPQNEQIGTYKLAYLGDGGEDWTAEVVDINKPGKNLIDDDAIENEKVLIKIVFKKVNVDSTALQGAEFTLKDKDGNVLDSELISDENGDFTPVLLNGKNFTLEEGIYFLEETKAPDGYILPAGDIQIQIDESGIPISHEGEERYKIETATETDNTTGEAITTYTILVTNSTGTALPETGGAGPEAYQLAGLLLMLTAAVWLWKQKQLRERGNVHSPKA